MSSQPADTPPSSPGIQPTPRLSEEDLKAVKAAAENAAANAVDHKLKRYAAIFGIGNLIVLAGAAIYIFGFLPESAADLAVKRYETKTEAIQNLLDDKVKTTFDRVNNFTAKADTLEVNLTAAQNRIAQQQKAVSEMTAATEKELKKLDADKDRLRKQVEEISKLDHAKILAFAKSLSTYKTPETILTQLSALKSELDAYSTGKKRMSSLHAGEFVLENGKGGLRGTLRVGEDDTGELALLDKQNPCLMLMVRKDGSSGLHLLDGERRHRGAFSLDAKGSPQVLLMDGKTHRAILDLDNNQPRLIFLDGSGTERCKFFLWSNGLPEMQLNDSKGKTRFVNRLDDPKQDNDFDELPVMWMNDRDGKDRTLWRLIKGGVPLRNP